MEFNLELAINTGLAKLNISEIPIFLHPRKEESKLWTFQDGGRSLRMMLIYCLNKVFLFPGVSLLAIGLLIHLIVLLDLVQYEGRSLLARTRLFSCFHSSTARLSTRSANCRARDRATAAATERSGAGEREAGQADFRGSQPGGAANQPQSQSAFQVGLWFFAVCFSPDGQQILNAGQDGTARLWSLDGKEVQQFKGHQGWVWSVAFSPDGQQILSAGQDGTVKLFPVETLTQLLEQGCTQLNNFLIAYPKDLQTLTTCQNDPNRLAAAALNLVKEAEDEARSGSVDVAIEDFRTALRWNPSLSFDPKARANQLANE